MVRKIGDLNLWMFLHPNLDILQDLQSIWPDCSYPQSKKMKAEILTAFTMSDNKPNYLATYSNNQTLGTQVNPYLDCCSSGTCTNMILRFGLWTIALQGPLHSWIWVICCGNMSHADLY